MIVDQSDYDTGTDHSQDGVAVDKFTKQLWPGVRDYAFKEFLKTTLIENDEYEAE